MQENKIQYRCPEITFRRVINNRNVIDRTQPSNDDDDPEIASTEAMSFTTSPWPPSGLRRLIAGMSLSQILITGWAWSI